MFEENIKPEEIKREWFLVDATDQPLGRLATRIADVLRGKHRAFFSPQWDMGDFVVIVNASQVKLSGNKAEGKLHYHHSGYPGGLKTKSAGKIREDHPEKLFDLAVRRMLPKNRLSRQIMKKMFVFSGTDHPYQDKDLKKIEID